MLLESILDCVSCELSILIWIQSNEHDMSTALVNVDTVYLCFMICRKAIWCSFSSSQTSILDQEVRIRYGNKVYCVLCIQPNEK